MTEKHLHLARTLGFCNGVRHALEVIETLLASGTGPLYVLHEIVHNNFVVESLKRRGVVFVDEPDDVPDGATLVLSAHGTAPAVRRKAEMRLHIADATCPLVRKVQQAAVEAEKNGERIVLFGHRKHPEAEGIIGHCQPGAIEVVEVPSDIAELAPDDGRTVCLLSQTTLNQEEVDAMTELLRKKFAGVRSGTGICYATRDRQQAVRELAGKVEYVLVLGSPKSSNSNRLCEVARRAGVPAELADSPDDLVMENLAKITELGLSAGASVPGELIRETVKKLETLGFQRVE